MVQEVLLKICNTFAILGQPQSEERASTSQAGHQMGTMKIVNVGKRVIEHDKGGGDH